MLAGNPGGPEDKNFQEFLGFRILEGGPEDKGFQEF